MTAEQVANDLVRAMVERHGGIDVLVNAVGIAVAGPPEAVSLDDWRAAPEVNPPGVSRCSP